MVRTAESTVGSSDGSLKSQAIIGVARYHFRLRLGEREVGLRINARAELTTAICAHPATSFSSLRARRLPLPR